MPKSSYTLVLWALGGWSWLGCQCAPVTLPGVPPNDGGSGCADGTREGFLSLALYPHIAACAGAWSVPGITAAGAAQGPVVPTCGRDAGNDSSNPNGVACSAADLCAEGWHICQQYAEVTANADTGCRDAVAPNVSNQNGSNYVLYAIAQHSVSGSGCNETVGDDDIFGCGVFGQSLQAANACGPLDQVLGSTLPNDCGYSQATPPNGPWQCIGSNSNDEGDFVTKNGCPNGSCSEGGYPYGSSDKGGVLCCFGPGP